MSLNFVRSYDICKISPCLVYVAVVHSFSLLYSIPQHDPPPCVIFFTIFVTFWVYWPISLLEYKLWEWDCSCSVLLSAVSLTSRTVSSTLQVVNEYLLNKWIGFPHQTLFHLVSPWERHSGIAQLFIKVESARCLTLLVSMLIVFESYRKILIWFDYLSPSACEKVSAR